MMDSNEGRTAAPLVTILWDERAPFPSSTKGLVSSLAAQAEALNLACVIHDTQRWGIPDLGPGMTLHVATSPRLHYPKPWRLNVLLVLEDVPEQPDNPEAYDLQCSVSGMVDPASASFSLSADGRPLDSGLLSQLLVSLTRELQSEPLAERMKRSLEQALAIAEHGSLVSVLLPTHDRLEFLGDALDSVLAQSYSNWELLVVQDGGPDVSDILAKRDDPRIRLLVQQQNQGKSAALNRALEQVRGEYVAYLDDDDIWLPDHLEANVRVMALTPGVRMTHSDGHRLQRRRMDMGWEVDESSRSLPFSGHASLEDILEHNSILGITVVHDRELFREAGPYDECLETLVDFDMWRRLAALTHPCHVCQVTAEYFVWAEDDPRRSQMTDLNVDNQPRYLANKTRVLSKRLPETVPAAVRDQWKQVRRSIRYEFLLQRGMHFLREEHNRDRALISLRRARGFCPPEAAARRVLATAFLEVGAAGMCLQLLQKNLASAAERRPADYFCACLAQLQIGQPFKVLALLKNLEQEFILSQDELELADRYRSLSEKALKR